MGFARFFLCDCKDERREEEEDDNNNNVVFETKYRMRKRQGLQIGRAHV